MSTLFKNANILNRNFEVIQDVNVYVEGNRIKKIYKDGVNDIRDKEGDINPSRVIYCNGYYLIPGFKNAHTHNAMVFLRSLSDDVPLDVWLNKFCFPNEAKLTYEDIYYFKRAKINFELSLKYKILIKGSLVSHSSGVSSNSVFFFK